MSTHNEYLAKRQLKRGTAGWLLLAGLGVSYVISGDFAGWNFGIGQAGWGGFIIAAVAMAVMYLTLVLSLAEMSAAIPAAGGGYSFARQAMGPTGGFITGLAVLIEYALAPAAIVIFIGSAVNELIGIDGPLVYALFYAAFIAIHLAGVGEALKVMMVISALAVLAIVVTAIALVGDFDSQNLFDIAPSLSQGSEFLPFGWYGVWAALPFAMWLFLAVEGVPLAAEEAKGPGARCAKGDHWRHAIFVGYCGLGGVFIGGRGWLIGDWCECGALGRCVEIDRQPRIGNAGQRIGISRVDCLVLLDHLWLQPIGFRLVSSRLSAAELVVDQ